jgi:hypothetical protein
VKIVIFSLFFSLVANAQGWISLRKNKEILRTYEELTGIKTDSEIQRIYDSSFLSLPKNGEVTELTGFTMVAMMNLSHTFCGKLIKKDISLPPENRWVHGKLDLSQEVAQWSDPKINELISIYADLFWGEPPSEKVHENLVSIFKGMSQIEQPMAQSVALSSTCTAMLMSPYVYTK